jgi:hypothetical protein
MFVTPQDLGVDPAAMPLWVILLWLGLTVYALARFFRDFNRGRY